MYGSPSRRHVHTGLQSFWFPVEFYLSYDGLREIYGS
jgi:hypothetical protein